MLIHRRIWSVGFGHVEALILEASRGLGGHIRLWSFAEEGGLQFLLFGFV